MNQRKSEEREDREEQLKASVEETPEYSCSHGPSDHQQDRQSPSKGSGRKPSCWLAGNPSMKLPEGLQHQVYLQDQLEARTSRTLGCPWTQLIVVLRSDSTEILPLSCFHESRSFFHAEIFSEDSALRAGASVTMKTDRRKLLLVH